MKVLTATANFIFLQIVFFDLFDNTFSLLFPQHNEFRSDISLDGLWTFVAEPSNSNGIGFQNNWSQIDLNTFDNATVMPVPSAFNDLTMDRSLRDHVGWVWYQTTHYVNNLYQKSSSNKKQTTAMLYFESVNYEAHVFLNGIKLGYHIGGHLPFEFPVHNLSLTQPLIITVAVNNTLSSETIPPGEFSIWRSSSTNAAVIHQTPNFDFFNYAGILRSVHLIHLPLNKITGLKLIATIENSKDSITGILNYEFEAFISPSYNDIEYGFIFELYLKSTGKQVYKNQTKSNAGTINLPNIKKWSPIGYGKPELYIAKVNLVIQNEDDSFEIVDLYRDTIGFRSISIDQNSIFINGKKFYCLGFGMHEDSEFRGRGFDRAVMTKDLNTLEWMGGNCYRTSHYPYSEERAREADRRGIAVITETPAVGMKTFIERNRQLHENIISEMIERDQNRPSVIMWSVANEPHSADAAAATYFRLLSEHTRKLDASRPVTIVLNTASDIDKAAEFYDVLCVNRYVGWYEKLGLINELNETIVDGILSWKNKFKKPFIVSEYGAEAIAGLSEDPGRPFSQQYQIEVLRETHKAFDFLRDNEKLSGEMIWNFADFATDNSITRVAGNHKGVLTRDRKPKPSAYMLQNRYKNLSNKKDEL